MEKVLAAILCGTFVCLCGEVVNPSEINGTETSDLIEYCEENEIHSEEELQSIIDFYNCEKETQCSIDDTNSDTIVSFDLSIDYENQFIITTTVYKTVTTRSTTSGYAIQNYRSSSGYIIFQVRADGEFFYNGYSCSTISATATFTPTAYLGWSSSPSSSSGKSDGRAYAKAYGTAVNGSLSHDYSVYLYCDIDGELSAD